MKGLRIYMQNKLGPQNRRPIVLKGEEHIKATKLIKIIREWYPKGKSKDAELDIGILRIVAGKRIGEYLYPYDDYGNIYRKYKDMLNLFDAEEESYMKYEENIEISRYIDESSISWAYDKKAKEYIMVLNFPDKKYRVGYIKKQRNSNDYSGEMYLEASHGEKFLDHYLNRHELSGYIKRETTSIVTYKLPLKEVQQVMAKEFIRKYDKSVDYSFAEVDNVSR